MRFLFHIFLHLGPAGPFLLGVADSSVLFLPVANDLLLVVLISRSPIHALEYVPAAAAGSIVGIFFLDSAARKGGEAGLEKAMHRKRFNYLKKKIREDAGYSVALASLAPPPFPFTTVVAAAAAFQYSRRKLLLIVFFSRLLRFAIVAALAIIFGPEVISVVKSPTFRTGMYAFIGVCALGTGISIAAWIRRRGRKGGRRNRAKKS